MKTILVLIGALLITTGVVAQTKAPSKSQKKSCSGTAPCCATKQATTVVPGGVSSDVAAPMPPKHTGAATTAVAPNAASSAPVLSSDAPAPHAAVSKVAPTQATSSASAVSSSGVQIQK